ncbi:MAG TPA: hypothetical protein VK982_11945 [Bacteroidales bacterium]|nr:hypothetical protein [Bacteroidales bacterium]
MDNIKELIKHVEENFNILAPYIDSKKLEEIKKMSPEKQRAWNEKRVKQIECEYREYLKGRDYIGS